MLATCDAHSDKAIATMEVRLHRTASDVHKAVGGYLVWKKRLDFTLALFLLILTSPILLIAVILTKLTSRGPIFYTQLRLGLNSHPFTIYKIRTMTHNCERTSGACWSIPGDPRVTLFGWLLRKSKVDELPQLWNVLRGDMSLIGPRPERPLFAYQLERAIPYYRERLQVLPGLSGLAQVQLPADVNLASVERKLRYDLCYVRNVSLLLDVKIMIATVLFLLGASYGLTRLIVRLPGDRPAWRDQIHEVELAPVPRLT